jgi:hypothetical protein
MVLRDPAARTPGARVKPHTGARRGTPVAHAPPSRHEATAWILGVDPELKSMPASRRIALDVARRRVSRSPGIHAGQQFLGPGGLADPMAEPRAAFAMPGAITAA